MEQIIAIQATFNIIAGILCFRLLNENFKFKKIIHDFIQVRWESSPTKYGFEDNKLGKNELWKYSGDGGRLYYTNNVGVQGITIYDTNYISEHHKVGTRNWDQIKKEDPRFYRLHGPRETSKLYKLDAEEVKLVSEYRKALVEVYNTEGKEND
jgi:hypothetical protein